MSSQKKNVSLLCATLLLPDQKKKRKVKNNYGIRRTFLGQIQLRTFFPLFLGLMQEGVGSYLDSTQSQVEIRILGLILVVWWTRLGSLQLYWVDYKQSYAQNMGPITHTYPYMQTYTHCKING